MLVWDSLAGASGGKARFIGGQKGCNGGPSDYLGVIVDTYDPSMA